MPATTDTINTTTTTNVAQSVVDENLPQLLDSRGGSYVTNVPTFDKEDFTICPLLKILYPNVKINGQMLRVVDVMKYVIKCKTAKEMWNDLILAQEGPSDTRDTKIAALSLKFNAFKSLEAELNATFVNSLPRKWLSMNQTHRANNSIKTIAWLHCMTSTIMRKDSDSYVEEEQRSSSEFLVDLNAEYQERALLANQKRFYKRFGRVRSARKPIDKTKETYESFDWNEESVSLEDEGTTRIRAFIAIAEDEPSVGKVNARFGQWVDITMKKDSKVIKGLSKCKVSKSNARRIQVKDIVKEVKDHLKIYSSAAMDIS
ncbi:hypothetical protein Tco_1167563 [Tanacetum coccineum]